MLYTIHSRNHKLYGVLARLMSDELKIRNSQDADIASITDIYAHEVLSGLASFELVPPDVSEMSKRRQQLLDQGHPYLVAIINNQVVGFAYAGPYRSRPAYQHTLENSVYVLPQARQSGTGKKLLAGLIDQCRKGNNINKQWHTIIAVIGDSENKASIALHQSLGFTHVGTLKDVGYKHNKWVDSVLMQKLL